MSEKVEEKTPKITLDHKISVILPQNISKIFLGICNSEKPLSSNSEYLQFLECFFILVYEINCVKKGVGKEIYKDVDVEKVVNNGMSLIKVMEQMKRQLMDSTKRRLEKCTTDCEKAKSDGTPLAPRIIRLSKELEFNETEQIAFGFVLVCQAGSCFPFYERSYDSATISCMSNYCNMNPEELLHFLSPRRKHIENGLIEIDKQYREIFSKFIMKMPRPCVNALCGSTLSTDEFLKIDKTALARILQKEPNFKLFNPKDEKKKEEKKEKKKKKGENGEEEDGEMDDEEDTAAAVAVPKKRKKKAKKEEEEEDGTFDLRKFIDRTIEKGDMDPTDDGKIPDTPDKVVDTVDSFLSPYKNNIDYCDDRFQLIATKVKIQNNESEKGDEERMYRTKERSNESILRELRAKERMLISKCEKRLEITRFTPRLEMLSKKRDLCAFEKQILVLLVGAAFSHDVQKCIAPGSRSCSGMITVGYILFILCDSLEERIRNRRYFYRNSTLVSDGMITIKEMIRSDLMDLEVMIDRRMLDFIVGLDTEFSEIVEGSNLYEPNVVLDQVILPAEQKKLIVETVENFEAFQSCRKRLGFDEIVSYGNSLILLFYGESGTGKTMTANALANHLGKKLLLINFSNLGENAGGIMRYIFRESKINNALLFFDECEAFFEKRDKYQSKVVPFLTEMERHDGLIIMATNLPHELDEAMHRRITLAIEFMPPDPMLREKIWKNHFPKDIKMDDENIDWSRLSLNYELTGGLIKNAVLSALSFAIARDGGDDPTIIEEDLIKGAKHQLRGIFTMNTFDRRIIPKHGLCDVVLSEQVEKGLTEVIQFEKARKVLFSQWGFSKMMNRHRGTSILLFGKQAGTGKRKAAEALAFELGAAIKCVDLGEILSKYVYNTTKNIEKLFQETRKTGAVLMIEMSTYNVLMKDSLAQLLNHISHYRGIVIVVTNLEGMITEEFTSHFKFVMEFEKPNVKMRQRIWEKLIPKEMPISEDVDLKKLASNYDFCGGNIENILVRAASRTALKKGKDNVKVTHKILDDACREELANSKFRSDATSTMYQ